MLQLMRVTRGRVTRCNISCSLSPATYDIGATRKIAVAISHAQPSANCLAMLLRCKLKEMLPCIVCHVPNLQYNNSLLRCAKKDETRRRQEKKKNQEKKIRRKYEKKYEERKKEK